MNVISGMRYERCQEAIEWLCTVLGFEKHAVYNGPDGTVQHAELTFGGGMIMLGPIRETPFSPYMVQPSAVNGRETRSAYLVVADPDVRVIYTRAQKAGAEILLDLRTESYGGEHFSCRDAEGHIWSVGSYDPWKK